jgi:PHP family Zn ribbon phosphoesterase
MYHIDGHRACGFSCTPEESKKLKNICPVCGKELVIGVLNRVLEIADRPEGFKPKDAIPYKQAVELDKIICEAFGIKSRNSKEVLATHHEMLKNLGPELDVLLELPLEQIKVHAPAEVVEGIRRMREGELFVVPGFDGQYGQVKIFSPEEQKNRQKTLF